MNIRWYDRVSEEELRRRYRTAVRYLNNKNKPTEVVRARPENAR